MTLNVTLTGPSELVPSHVPGMFLIVANAFCASFCAIAYEALITRIGASSLLANLVMAFPFRFMRTFTGVRCGIYFLALARIFGLDERFQIVQACGPEDTVLLNPGIHRPQGLGVEMVDPIAAFPVLPNQVSPAKEP